MISIDHICLGVKNVYEGAERFREETGFGNYDGGWFPATGCAVRMVPLGADTYLEIEAIFDVFSLEEHKPGALWFRDQVAQADGDVFIGWCARVDSREELQAVAARLGSEVLDDVIRIRPDGSSRHSVRTPDTLTCWDAGLPNFFLIEDMAHHPSRVVPTLPHRVQPGGISWLELGGSPDDLWNWLGVAGGSLPLRFNGKAPGLHAFGVKTDDGEVVVRRDALSSGLLKRSA